MRENDLKEMDRKIRLIRRTAEELQRMASDFPALKRNTARILASVRMLEINVTDIVEFYE
jgi:hypothetical protein